MERRVARDSRGKRRKPLRGSAEGTLANIGRVAHLTDRDTRPNRPVGNQRLRIDDAPPRRVKTPRHSQDWRPYQPRRQGPFTRYVHEDTPQPNCIYCCGPTQLVGSATSCDHIVRFERRWRCADRSCLGWCDEIVDISTHGEYERRG